MTKMTPERDILGRLADQLATATTDRGSGFATAIEWLQASIEAGHPGPDVDARSEDLADLVRHWRHVLDLPQTRTLQHRIARLEEDLRAVHWAAAQLELQITEHPPTQTQEAP